MRAKGKSRLRSARIMRHLERRFKNVMSRRRLRLAILVLAAAVGAAIVVLAYLSLFKGGGSHGHKHHDSSHKKSSVQNTDESSAKPSKSSGSAPSSNAANTVYPANILNLTNWKLTLPIGSPGDPTEITQPDLATYSQAPYFYVDTQKNGVVFQAPVGGVTTENSHYPRSELREMADDGASEASWSDTSGTNVMTIRQAITHLPSAKPEVVAGQIHDADDDVILIRLEGSKLFVEGNDKNVGTLDADYHLGAVFTVRVVAAGGHIKVFYNGVQKVDYARSGSGYYFKAGCYTQSNPDKGDSPSAYGQVVIYSLSVSHS